MPDLIRNNNIVCLICFSLFFFNEVTVESQQTVPVYITKEGKLEYVPDSMGNRIPDFSYCGYKSGEQEIPLAPIKVFIPWQKSDASNVIQQAIDYVSALPQDENGFRGAILLEKGIYSLTCRLLINASGVVLRGSGMHADGTVLLACGQDRETLIKISGVNDVSTNAEVAVQDGYVPVNATKLIIGNNHPFKTGDRVMVRRPTTTAWIKALGMESFGGETGWLGWKAGSNDIIWDRTVTAADAHSITLDAPLTTALDTTYGDGFVASYSWEGRISNVGIENICCRSSFNPENIKDEDHAWMAITIENAKDCWVRQVVFEHFAGSAVAVYETAKQITVEDCISLCPVSEIGGQRRITFFTSGQQTLFQRCYAEYGYHDFAVGHLAPGPNAFVQCEACLPYSFSGTIDRWASGVLYDMVNIDGNTLSFINRGQDGQGAGWTAANSMIWQCSAARIDCYAPPTANNWAFGVWGQFSGNGYWYEPNSHIKPRSLYYAQLSQRIGEKAMKRAFFLPLEHNSTSSPTVEEARSMTEKSKNPQVKLIDWIRQAGTRTFIPVEKGDAKPYIPIVPKKVTTDETLQKAISVKSGWIIRNGAVVTGQTIGTQWWRGTTRPDAVLRSGHHITRFVPGRTGVGFTDDLGQVTDEMVQKNILAIDHNYGLWYDRRRDDHERIRRMNGEVWPPFYEQPYARSGRDVAWDGLSRYDLMKPNPWYWMRLKQFAGLADEKGLILIHQNYFQHNILEAGAHWADFPWRSANNINNTVFPEPPPYCGGKRIFMAEQFYDITHPVRRELHKQYIRQCLSNFADNKNVIQLTCAEYTGPLHFIEFWLDVIIEWEKETGKNALTGLSVTKDVQDAILSDPVQSPSVDIIDIRYWHYRSDDSLYAPEGGQNLAPRQHARLVNPGKVSFESVYRAVSEYRLKYPEKAVIYSGRIDPSLECAVFMAGGSMAAIPGIEDRAFLIDAATMKPVVSKNMGIYTLANMHGGRIIYFSDKFTPEPVLPGNEDLFDLTWINPVDGQIIKTENKIKGGSTYKADLPTKGDVVLWIRKSPG
ncbi:MAG: pectate lyase [Bacteroidales bacterium]|nr:pectate lyase [Bacteroidales bacterium]